MMTRMSYLVGLVEVVDVNTLVAPNIYKCMLAASTGCLRSGSARCSHQENAQATASVTPVYTQGTFF